jgi:DNA adenine methylase
MSGDVDTLSLSEQDAQNLCQILLADDQEELLNEIVQEWMGYGTFIFVEDDQPPQNVTEQQAMQQSARLEQEVLDQMDVVEVKKSTPRDQLIAQYKAQLEQEEKDTVAREALVELYKAQLEAQDDEVKHQEVKRFYADFVTNDKTLLSIRKLGEWENSVQDVGGQKASKAYVAELRKTEPVSLAQYTPLATYPFAYTGAKDLKECGFIAQVMRMAKGQNVRLVEPFVGGARVFMACDFASNLIADLDPTLYALYTIIQQYPELAHNYCDDIKGKVVAFKSYSALFDASVNYLTSVVDWKTLLSDAHTPEAKKDWARSYIFVRNRAQRPQIEFGKVNAPYTGVKDETKYQKEEQEALVLLSNKLRTKDHVIIKCQSWEKTFAEAHVGDIIYADPPYVNFTMRDGDQNTSGAWYFPWPQHVKLAKKARKNADLGIPVFISNWATPEILKLYREQGANRIYTYCWKKSQSKFACLAAFLPS